MIKFSKNGDQVRMKVTVNIPYVGEIIYWFDWNCANKEYAGLLADKMNNEFGNAIEKARREEYKKGYKDGKHHNKKETWFKPWL